MNAGQIARCHENEQKRTHQTFRPRLTTYSLYFTDVIEGYAILAEETAVCDKIPLHTIRRKDRVLRFGRGPRCTDKGSKWY
jgi:hypothetical protein